MDSTPPARDAAPCQVLVVDDCADLRNLVRLRLAMVEGFSVVGEAVDGEEGVAQAARLQPDLVLLDLTMPRMDGLQALPLIRQAAPGARVVVFSGLNESLAETQALAAGADRYVVKGIALKELVEVIASVASR